MPIARLDRTIFRLSGKDVSAWFEGLITNSLVTDNNVSPLTFAALLTPQGKIIADFFVWQRENHLLVDTPTKFGDALLKRLKMYRLRAPITLEDVSDDMEIHALWGDDVSDGTPDPRHGSISRMLSPASQQTDTATLADWDHLRLSLNIPDSQWDFETAETFPANANMDRLSGIDFKKGCYVGQEVVSRMYRKTQIRKRFCAFSFDPMSAPEDDAKTLHLGDRVVGDVVHRHGGLGMAMVRFDRLPAGHSVITLGGANVTLIDPILQTSGEF